MRPEIGVEEGKSAFKSYKECLQIFNVLASVSCTTTFEELLLQKIESICAECKITHTRERGQLLVGNPDALYTIVAHADRVGLYVNVRNGLHRGKAQFKYISPITNEGYSRLYHRFGNCIFSLFHPDYAEPIGTGMLVKSGTEIHFEVLNVSNQCAKEGVGYVPATACAKWIAYRGYDLLGYFDNSLGIAIGLWFVQQFREQVNMLVTTSEEGCGLSCETQTQSGIEQWYQAGKNEKLFVIIDARPCSISEGETTEPIHLGRGVVIRTRELRDDKVLVSADPIGLQSILTAQEQLNVSIQFWNGRGITEGGRLQEAARRVDESVRVIWLQYPLAMNHCPVEIVNATDINNLIKLGVRTFEIMIERNASQVEGSGK